jgi:hypothetical protein
VGVAGRQRDVGPAARPAQLAGDGVPHAHLPTPSKTTTIDQASAITGGTAGAAGTAGINASAEGAGAKTVLLPDDFNVLNGWLWVPTPAEVYDAPAGASAGFGLHFPAAPTTLTAWSAGITYQEN